MCHLHLLGRKAYRDACSQLGIIPVSFVMEHITREKIDIKHHGLGPSGARAIAFALMRNTTTTTVNLRDCAIGKCFTCQSFPIHAQNLLKFENVEIHECNDK